jgi:hypothetical protein
VARGGGRTLAVSVAFDVYNVAYAVVRGVP